MEQYDVGNYFSFLFTSFESMTASTVVENVRTFPFLAVKKVTDSVTRFGEISPLWHNFNYWAIF